MERCKNCGSFAINHHQHNRDGSDPQLCDVCYWRKRATDTTWDGAVSLEEAFEAGFQRGSNRHSDINRRCKESYTAWIYERTKNLPPAPEGE